MVNLSNNAYALTVLSPIRKGHVGEIAFSDEVRNRLQSWGVADRSPMASVPQTYLCRYFVLDDVVFESLAGGEFAQTIYEILSIFFEKFRYAALPAEDHLQSKYLVFSCNLHGDPESYLRAMWNAISDDIRQIWGFCYGFGQVHDAGSFAAYIKRCQVAASLFYVGSTDDSLEEQLKSLYIKQEFSRFVVEHQGLPASELQKAYNIFIQRVAPKNLMAPSWSPGQASVPYDKRLSS